MLHNGPSAAGTCPVSNVDILLERVENLPPAPAILPQLLSLLGQVDVDIGRVVDLVAFDPGLTAKLLQTCNSAFFAAAGRVNDVTEAVQRLGFQAVYRLVAVVIGTHCLRPSPRAGLDASQFWRHSVTTAFAAQLVAEDTGGEASLLFTAGLLHDIGKLILASACAEDYRRLMANTPCPEGASTQAEMTRFGTDHAAIGARLLGRWRFSPQFTAGVRFHHALAAAGASTRSAATIAVADVLAHDLQRPPGSGSEPAPPPNEALAILGLQPDALYRYQDRLTENAQFVEGICRMQN